MYLKRLMELRENSDMIQTAKKKHNNKNNLI